MTEEFYENWKKNIIEKPWNVNMADWQRNWKTKCSYFCCYSKDCGDIRCAGCSQSIVRPVQRALYSCLECPVDLNSEMALTYCFNCFEDIRNAHPHKYFLKVDESGEHAALLRRVGFEKLRPITIEHLVHHTPLEGEECSVCCANFLLDQVEKVSMPGCKVAHGISGEPVCSFCLLYFIATKPALGNGFFSQTLPENICLDCRNEEIIDRQKEDLRKELQVFKEEFDKINVSKGEEIEHLFRNYSHRINIDLRNFVDDNNWDNYFDYFKLLQKSIHPQKYLHNFIDSNFK